VGNGYKDLEVWQKAIDLVVICYQTTRSFPQYESFGLSSQIQRAAVSIPANIAEGRERQQKKEFVQHISIAYGSLAELETHILIAERVNYIDEKVVAGFFQKTSEVGKMLNGLRRSIRDKRK
jgi:four helix bundle protein